MGRTIAAVLATLAALATVSPAAADLRQMDGEVCYDMLVVGTVKSYGEFTSYYEMDPDPDSNAIYIGGRQEMTVSVEEVIEGQDPPRAITVRALMGSAYRLPVRMLFYIQPEERGSYWAADWMRVERDASGRIQTRDDPPPRCPRTAPAGS